MPSTPCDTFPGAVTTALEMAPRARPSPEIVEDVVVCAPLTAAASRSTTQPPREIPCLGCLIVLVNWIPEDGSPFPCSDSNPPGKDEKCVRCTRRSKSCYKATFEEEKKRAQELASLLDKKPLDFAAIKRTQDGVKEELSFHLNAEAQIYGHWSDDLDDEANQLLNALRANVDTARWVMKTASDITKGPLIQRAMHVVDSVSSMVDAVRETTPPQFADLAAEEVGFF